MVKQAQAPGARHLAQLDADDVAGVTPVFLDRNRLGERVHGVENHQVRAAEQRNERLGLARVAELVLGIGRIHHALAAALEAVAVGIAGVRLQHRGYRHARDVVSPAGLQLHEFDGCRQAVEIHREGRRRMLLAERAFQRIVAAVDADAVAGEIGGGEKRKPHDVIPVHV
ncbi:hypothetical protein D3C83_10960 [compost metagenome]